MPALRAVPRQIFDEQIASPETRACPGLGKCRAPNGKQVRARLVLRV